MMTAEDFLVRYPEFVGTSEPLLAVVMSDAVPFFDLDRWDDLLDQGYSALVAHMLATKKMEGVSSGYGTGEGQVQSKQADGVAVTFASQATYKVVDSDLARTSYGMTYIRLRRLVGAGCVAI